MDALLSAFMPDLWGQQCNHQGKESAVRHNYKNYACSSSCFPVVDVCDHAMNVT
jgi:hypothetical protein